MTDREILARAIVSAMCPDHDIDYIKSVPSHPLWRVGLQQADACLSALRERGLTIVPIEPTPDIRAAFAEVAWGEGLIFKTGDDQIDATWSAMLSAASSD